MADFFSQIGERVPPRVGEEPDFHVLASDKRAHIARGIRGFFLKEASYGATDEPDEEIVVHFERVGRKIRRAKKNLFFIENEDFAVHEPRLVDRVDARSCKACADIWRAGGIVEQGGRDGGLDFLR